MKPNKIDIQSNYRYYTDEQLTLVIVIKHFKEAGFSLKEIKQLLGRENLEYNQKKISEKCIEIDNKIKIDFKVSIDSPVTGCCILSIMKFERGV